MALGLDTYQEDLLEALQQRDKNWELFSSNYSDKINAQTLKKLLESHYGN
jgi:hypothetical protein